FMAPVAFASGMTANPLVNTAMVTDVASGATASGADSDALAPQVTLAVDKTATATDLLSGAIGSGTDSDARSPQVSLAVTKTDGSATYTPGGTATYTVTV